jgi:hypothetical protein
MPPATLSEPIRRYRALGQRQDAAFSVLLDEFLDAFYEEGESARRQVTGRRTDLTPPGSPHRRQAPRQDAGRPANPRAAPPKPRTRAAALPPAAKTS